MDKVLNRKQQIPLRRQLRNHPSAAEALLWSRLRSSQLGAKFRRQQGVGRYVVDFYCPSAGLVIEMDGDSHCNEVSEIEDSIRQSYIESQAVRVLRFRNDDIFSDIDAMLTVIQNALRLVEAPGNHP